jgi:DNA repair protein RecN (Recombination protein N)
MEVVEVSEQELLKLILKKLNNVEIIKESQILSYCYNEEQIGVLNNLKEIKVALQKISFFFHRL